MRMLVLAGLLAGCGGDLATASKSEGNNLDDVGDGDGEDVYDDGDGEDPYVDGDGEDPYVDGDGEDPYDDGDSEDPYDDGDDEEECPPECEEECEDHDDNPYTSDECECECEEPPGACFLVIDEDGIDNGLPPNFFDAGDVNDDLAEIGVREQLGWFSDHDGETVELWTGEVGDEGWFAPQEIPSSWVDAGPTSDGLRNFVGSTDAPFPHDVGPGLGTADSQGDREALLDKIPDVTPLRATGLARLVGQDVCALVYDSDVSINYDPLNGSVKGANLGTVAFHVEDADQLFGESSSSLPVMTVEVLDADEVCARDLAVCEDMPRPDTSSEPFDIVP